MKNDKSELNGTVNQQHAGQVIDDIWSTFPNVHLRVLTAEKESIEIQICDCGMSGQCRPQAWARIERHNRERLARAIAAAPSGDTAASKCVKCRHNQVGLSGYCIHQFPDHHGNPAGGYLCGCKCEFTEPEGERE